MMAGHTDGAPGGARINLHNHTTWSDGRFPPDQIVRAAVVHGLTHVGISDHYYTAKLGTPELYVSARHVALYRADLEAVANAHAGELVVLAGLEVDWSRRSAEQLPALWPALDAFDYVLFEYVDDPAWRGESLEALIEVLPPAHIPVGLAHNDLSANYPDLESLVASLNAHEVFIELSTFPGTDHYVRDDPRTRRLWDLLAGSSVRFSIGSDTHAELDAVGRVDAAHRFLAERGLLDRLITARMDGRAAHSGQRPVRRRSAQETVL